jgi:hypothetical protein
VSVFVDLQTLFLLYMSRNIYDLSFGQILPASLKSFINKRKVIFDFKLSPSDKCSDAGKSPKGKNTQQNKPVCKAVISNSQTFGDISPKVYL